MSHHVISLYDTHEDAVAAVKLLKEAGFSSKHISLLGKADTGDEDQKSMSVAAKGVGLGALVGVLAGVGLAAIPGIGVLYGLGAVAGAVAGFDFGVIGGTVVSALAIAGMNKDVAARYEEQLKAGKTLLSFSGNEEETRQARTVLEGQGIHTELNDH